MDESGQGTGDITATDELLEIVLDRLGPAIAAYRRESARRAGLEPDELLALDRLRRVGRASAGSVGGWLGVTRGALSRILRRLEDAGHLARWVPPRRGQAVEVMWRPHAARDAALDELRARARRDLDGMVATYRLDDPERHAVVAWWTVLLADMFARHAREMEDAVVEALVLERHRQQRAAMPDPWRGR